MGKYGKAGSSGAGRGALTGVQAAAPVAGALAFIPGIGVPLAGAALGLGAGIGAIGGLIGGKKKAREADRLADEQKQADKELQAAMKVSETEFGQDQEQLNALNQASAQQAARRSGGTVSKEDMDAQFADSMYVGSGNTYDQWRKSIFGG